MVARQYELLSPRPSESSLFFWGRLFPPGLFQGLHAADLSTQRVFDKAYFIYNTSYGMSYGIFFPQIREKYGFQHCTRATRYNGSSGALKRQSIAIQSNFNRIL